jgi:hypothetical protein
MRLLYLGFAALALSATVSAQVYVNGYTKSNGTYVAPHYRSSPDNTPLNNYSTKGNVNPYTGKAGTQNPYGSSYSNPSSSYGSAYGNSSTSQPKSSSCTYSIYC